MTCGFIAYIDESGDPGLRRVRPRTAGGASEWFVLSCVLIRADRDREVVQCVRDILSRINSRQRSHLHYRELIDSRKRIVCEAIADFPLRCFVVMSNKKNMEGYRNPRPFPEANWFYAWMTRLLLERVTKFCHDSCNKLYGETRPVRLIFSRRGGLSYYRIKKYLGLLQFQSEIGHLYIKTHDICWQVIDLDEIQVLDHPNRAGLQLADAVAGAFYQAVAVESGRACAPEFAKILKPRMYRHNRQILERGIKTMPKLRDMALSQQQREIFEFYGFPSKAW